MTVHNLNQRWAWPTRRQWIYSRDLVRELVVRDLKLLYKRSVLGIAWTLLNPLLQLLVLSFIFRNVLKIQVTPSYAFSGLLIWTWSQTALYQATGLITQNRALIRQPGFAIAILPVITVTTGLIHFMLALPVLALFAWIDRVQVGASLLWLPILLAIQFLLTVSFAYPLAALNVIFQDTQHTLGVLLQLMFYALPIFYTLEGTVPADLQIFYLCNPIVLLLQAYRAVLINNTWPNFGALLGLIALGLVLLPLGYTVFKRQSERFVEEI